MGTTKQYFSSCSKTQSGLSVVGGVVSAVLIPVDMAFAGWSVYKLATGSVPEKADELQGLINLLQNSIEQVEAAAAHKDFQALLRLFPMQALEREDLAGDGAETQQKENEAENRYDAVKEKEAKQ